MPLSLDKHMFRAYDIRGVAYEQVHPEAAYAIAFEFGELVKENKEFAKDFRLRLVGIVSDNILNSIKKNEKDSSNIIDWISNL